MKNETGAAASAAAHGFTTVCTGDSRVAAAEAAAEAAAPAAAASASISFYFHFNVNFIFKTTFNFLRQVYITLPTSIVTGFEELSSLHRHGTIEVQSLTAFTKLNVLADKNISEIKFEKPKTKTKSETKRVRTLRGGASCPSRRLPRFRFCFRFHFN